MSSDQASIVSVNKLQPRMMREWVYLLAYNLIRLLMAQAAQLANVLPRQLSFKRTLQLWLVWRQINHGNEIVEPYLF